MVKVVKMQFGKIRDLREDHDLKQFEVAKILGVKRTTYAMWDLGDVDFPMEKLVELARYFHTNVEYMLNLTSDNREVFYEKDITVEFIGNQLKRYRLKLKKTQREFAKVLNIRQSSYSYYEDGKTRIPTNKLVLLAMTYHIPINYICGGKRKEKISVTL